METAGKRKVKKDFDNVVTRDYIAAMKRKTTKYPVAKSQPMALKEVAVASGVGDIINVRSAKTHLSALLEWVAGGHEITITSDGKPKAKLIRAREAAGRKTFSPGSQFMAGRQPRNSSGKIAIPAVGDVSGFRHRCEIARARTR